MVMLGTNTGKLGIKTLILWTSMAILGTNTVIMEGKKANLGVALLYFLQCNTTSFSCLLYPADPLNWFQAGKAG